MRALVWVTGLILTVGLSAGAQPAWARQQSKGKHAQKSDAKLSAVDRAFIETTAGGNLMAVELGKVARDKAASADVKSYADRIVKAHMQSGDELKRLAEKKGVTLPSKLNDKQAATVRQMRSMSGAEFDRSYMRMMLEDHRNEVASFRQEQRQASDPDLKTWVTETLPTLENHLRIAQNINSKLSVGKAKR